VIALDVNETLSDMEPLNSRFEAVGAPRHLRATWFASTLRDGFALTAAGAYADFGQVAHAALKSILSREPGLRHDPDDAAQFILAGIRELSLHPDVRPGIERLHAHAIRLVALTNGPAGNAQRLLERGGIAPSVEDCLSVEGVRRWKPAPEPYLYAAERCGVVPEQMMLVAVHPWDVDGAKRAGLASAWINRDDVPYPEPLEPPDLVCRDFVELAAALSR
jgi:2-haloacid dehalogenase